jgi:hypothetical protein
MAGRIHVGRQRSSENREKKIETEKEIHDSKEGNVQLRKVYCPIGAIIRKQYKMKKGIVSSKLESTE